MLALRTLVLAASLAGALVAGATPAAGQERTLRWPAIDVTAHLDSSGRLTVRERQTILLSGDWNGPERTFVHRAGQRVELTSLTRRDPATGAERVLTEGDLSAVDQYHWTNSRTLRWRSRLPGDPPFVANTLIYTLGLRYENILVPVVARDSGEATTYRLAHDFAFTDRNENIDRFSLTLTLDPAWQAPAGFTGRFGASDLPPGEGFIVTLPLAFVAEGRPGTVEFGAAASFRYALLAAFLAAVALIIGRLIAGESALGRFRTPPDTHRITDAWLQEHVFSMAPEVAGTAWDDSTSAPEVAATLARLVASGQLSSEVRTKHVWKFRSDVLHLELRTGRDQLSTHDRALIDALFPGKATKTSTDIVRKHYASKGFDPSALIRAPLKERLDSLPGAGARLAPPSGWPTRLLMVGALSLIILAATQSATQLMVVAAGTGLALAGFVLAFPQAAVWQKRVRSPAAHLLRVLIPVLLMVVALSTVLAEGRYRAGAVALGGLTLLVLALINSTFNIARSRHDAARLALRKRLAAAREHFLEELRRPTPTLDDKWFPWLIAFGLGPHIDRWFKAFGGESVAAMASTRTGMGSGSSSSSSAPSWTGFGGGGGFSGGGSSASFASAVGGMAGAVSAPSSSSSGGGGGGGGSSGGGGGGGW
jgi:uncharacterized membrane protein YgcG